MCLLRNTAFIRAVYDTHVLESGELQSFKLTNEFLFVFSEQRGEGVILPARRGRGSISHRAVEMRISLETDMLARLRKTFMGCSAALRYLTSLP